MIGNDRLAWLVVVQRDGCPHPRWGICMAGATSVGWNLITVVDAHDGGVVTDVQLGVVGVVPPPVEGGSVGREGREGTDGVVGGEVISWIS